MADKPGKDSTVGSIISTELELGLGGGQYNAGVMQRGYERNKPDMSPHYAANEALRYNDVPTAMAARGVSRRYVPQAGRADKHSSNIPHDPDII